MALAAEIERSTRAASPPTVATPTSAPPSVRMPVRSSAAWRPRPLSPTACRLDALQALLAALADRDQLGLDRPATLDRQADGIRLRASGMIQLMGQRPATPINVRLPRAPRHKRIDADRP
jgi:hypothetical protein